MGSNTNKPAYFISGTVALFLLCSLFTFQYKISDLRADLEATERKLQQLQEANPLQRSKRYVKTSQPAAKDDFVEQFQTQQSESFNNRLFFVEQKLEQFVTKVVVQLKGTQSAQQSQLLKIHDKFTHIFDQLKKHDETILDLVSKSLLAEVQASQYLTLSEKVTKLEELRAELSGVDEEVLGHTKLLQSFKEVVDNITVDFHNKFDVLTLSVSNDSQAIEESAKRQANFETEIKGLETEITQLSAHSKEIETQLNDGVLHIEDKFRYVERNLSNCVGENIRNAESYKEVEHKLSELETIISEHNQSLQDAQGHDVYARREIDELRDKLANLGDSVKQYLSENSESYEKLQKKLQEVEEKVFKHAGLFKDMYAAQTEVTGVIPEVTQLSNNFTHYLAEYSTKNKENVKIQIELQKKLDDLEVEILTQGKQFQNVHALEERADHLVHKFQEQLASIKDDLSKCDKENADNQLVQEKLQQTIHVLEQKISGYESLSEKVLGFEEFESILLKAIDLSKLLYIAVNQNDSRTLEVLLKLNVDVEFRDAKGLRPLTSAVRYYRNDFVALLLDKGAKVNVQDTEGRTPLHWAAAVNNVMGAKLLLEKKADVNCVDAEQKSPLILAAMHGHVEMLDFLIKEGANVEQKDELSARAIHWATTMGHTNCVRNLINAGADINSESGHQTPLILAAKTSQFEILQLLLEKKANVDASDAKGNTPLILAAGTGHIECVQTLLDHGADVERRNERQETALMIVAKKGYQEILTLLLDRGAQTTSVDSAGDNALSFARKAGHVTCIKILMLRGDAK